MSTQAQLINPSERLHGLDALRATTLVMILVVHAAMPFAPSAIAVGWPIADVTRSPLLEEVYFVMRIFRMSALFVLAGFFGHLSLERRGLRSFMLDRTKRILVPLVVGWIALIPLAGTAAVLAYMHRHGGKLPEPSPNSGGEAWLGHLWFLYFLVLVYAVMLPLRLAVLHIDTRSRVRNALDAGMRVLVSSSFAPLLLALPIASCLYYDDWRFPWGIPTPGFIPNVTACIGYGLAFVFGWLLHRQVTLLHRLAARWSWNLAIALALTVALLSYGISRPPAAGGWERMLFMAAYAVAAWAWTFGLIGVGLKFFGRANAVRRYFADSSYWIYLVHLPIICWLQLAMMDWQIHWAVKFSLTIAVALSLLLLSYHYLVRSTRLGEVLNGRRYPRSGRVNPELART
jgi:peptidoglycan/LPS O-acetylase OafA/YrhL